MKIICIGRNYSAHAKELGNAVPAEPVVFMKPSTAILRPNEFYIPDYTNQVHYELELVVKISKNGRSTSPKFASKYYESITLGIDFTARDLQESLMAQGLPWEKAKAFDNSAFLGPWKDKKDYDLENLSFSLQKNNDVVQVGTTKDMLHSVDELIAYVSKFFTLQQGDVIFTGTPPGVGRIDQGDTLVATLEEEKMFELQIK